MRLLLCTVLTILTCGAQSLPVVLARAGKVETGVITTPNLQADAAYSLLFSTRSLRPDSRVALRLISNDGTLCQKTLHAGDPDVYAPFHLTRNGAVELQISAEQST